MSTRISARPRGPLVIDVDGPVEVTGPDGLPRDVAGRTRLMFCRCGASQSRPFCDGSHNRTGFEAPEPETECEPQDDLSTATDEPTER